MTAEPKKLVATFLVLTTVLAAICYSPILAARTLMAGGGIWVFALMWSPGVSALITRFVWQRNLEGIGWRWGPSRYPAFAYLLPPLASLLVYGIVWLTGLGGVSVHQFSSSIGRSFGQPSISLPVGLLLAATVGVLFSLISATGEELGWRGLLVPELAKTTSFTATALTSGAIWALYHYPAILLTDYHAAGSRAVSMTAFTVLVFAAGVILTWLRLRSGSVWPAAIFHASHNLFVQDVFDRLTVPKPGTQYVTTEFGVGLAVVYCAVAVWLWRRRGEIAASAPIEAINAPPASAALASSDPAAAS